MPNCIAIHDSQGLFCTQTFNHWEVRGNNKMKTLMRYQPRVGPELGRNNLEVRPEAGVAIQEHFLLSQLGLLLPSFVLPQL